MPVEKTPKNYLGVTEGFSSGKNGRTLRFKSLREKDCMVRLDFDPEVERLDEQPVRIPIEAKGRRPMSYVPEVLVHYRLPEMAKLERLAWLRSRSTATSRRTRSKRSCLSDRHS